jgi:hypothetical protein
MKPVALCDSGSGNAPTSAAVSSGASASGRWQVAHTVSGAAVCAVFTPWQSKHWTVTARFTVIHAESAGVWQDTHATLESRVASALI